MRLQAVKRRNSTRIIHVRLGPQASRLTCNTFVNNPGSIPSHGFELTRVAAIYQEAQGGCRWYRAISWSARSRASFSAGMFQ
jgi:hypothetical protein